MVESCSFCGYSIERGTGKTVVRKDGTLLNFCSRKCEKNLLELKRNPLQTPWTKSYLKFRGKLKPEEQVAVEAGPKKVKKGAMPKFVPEGEAAAKEEKPAEEKEIKEEKKEKPKKKEAKPKMEEEKPTEAEKAEKAEVEAEVSFDELENLTKTLDHDIWTSLDIKDHKEKLEGTVYKLASQESKLEHAVDDLKTSRDALKDKIKSLEGVMEQEKLAIEGDKEKEAELEAKITSFKKDIENLEGEKQKLNNMAVHMRDALVKLKYKVEEFDDKLKE
jgi:large subunit ribosomal protein L24e